MGEEDTREVGGSQNYTLGNMTREGRAVPVDCMIHHF